MKADSLAPYRFTYMQKSRWKAVDSASVARIANASCPGASFNGCSKSDVYESLQREQKGYRINRKKFENLMDEAATILPPLRRQLFAAVGKLITDYKEPV
jgi:hypothetical protein